jgi:hypothetical protein
MDPALPILSPAIKGSIVEEPLQESEIGSIVGSFGVFVTTAKRFASPMVVPCAHYCNIQGWGERAGVPNGGKNMCAPRRTCCGVGDQCALL